MLMMPIARTCCMYEEAYARAVAKSSKNNGPLPGEDQAGVTFGKLRDDETLPPR
jgi:hypothetical protein